MDVSAKRAVFGLGFCLLALSCSQGDTLMPPPGDKLAVATWGGNNAGVIVDDTIAHVHVGCTYGNFTAPITIGSNGQVHASGSYMLRAYPIAIGPSLPAQFNGTLSGARLTFTVVVNDTVEKKTTTLGPAVVYYKQDASMGPCPICRKPKALQ